MIVKLLTEHNFEFLRLKGGCRGPSESTHVKIPHCWKSHALAHIEWFKPTLICISMIPLPDFALIFSWVPCQDSYNQSEQQICAQIFSK